MSMHIKAKKKKKKQSLEKCIKKWLARLTERRDSVSYTRIEHRNFLFIFLQKKPYPWLSITCGKELSKIMGKAFQFVVFSFTPISQKQMGLPLKKALEPSMSVVKW